MTDYFVVFGEILIAIPIYLLNGFLATLYWIADSGAAWVSMLCAGLIMRFVDQRVQSHAGYAADGKPILRDSIRRKSPQALWRCCG